MYRYLFSTSLKRDFTKSKRGFGPPEKGPRKGLSQAKSFKMSTELTVAYQFSYRDYDDQEDYNEKKFIDDYKKELSKRNNVDAIIISTGYLDYLKPKNIKELNVSAIIEEDITVFNGGGIENLYEIFKDEEIEGLVFKNTRATDAIDLILKLGKINYCAECGMRNIDRLVWYNIDDKTILYVSVDTCSI